MPTSTPILSNVQLAIPSIAQNLTLTRQQVELTGGDITTTSTTFVDATGMTLTVARTITASTSDVSTTTTVSLSAAGAATSTLWGFNSQAEIVNFVTAVSTMQLAMKQLGIIAS